MLKDDTVEAMIALPGQLFLNTQVPCCLWFLTNDKTKNGRDRRNETLFIDARNLGKMETRILKVLTEDDIKKITNTINNWRKGNSYEDIKGFCKSAKIKEIQENEFIISPGRYVGFEDNEENQLLFDENIKKLILDLEKIKEESNEVDKSISIGIKNFFS